MSIFNHVLIVMSGTLLVPYGFTVLNGCSVIAASAGMALRTALLTVKLRCSFFIFFIFKVSLFLSWWRRFLHLLLTVKKFQCLGKQCH